VLLFAIGAAHRELAVRRERADFVAAALEPRARAAQQHAHAAELDQRMRAGRADQVRATLLQPKTLGRDNQSRVTVQDRAGPVVQSQARAAVGVGDDLVVQTHTPEPLHASAVDADARMNRFEIGQRRRQHAVLLAGSTAQQHESSRDTEQQGDDR
jgi:hypothetical protein